MNANNVRNRAFTSAIYDYLNDKLNRNSNYDIRVVTKPGSLAFERQSTCTYMRAYIKRNVDIVHVFKMGMYRIDLSGFVRHVLCAGSEKMEAFY